jgi:hypothetical protein
MDPKETELKIREAEAKRSKMLEQSRANYKSMHTGTAKNKGVLGEFLAASTKTEMRKVLWGHKKKNTRGSR